MADLAPIFYDEASSCILEVNMKSSSFAKALTLGCVLCLSLPVACGDDESNPKPGPGDAGAGGEPAGGGGVPASEGGAGGAAPTPLPPGISDMPKTEACGAEMCTSASVGPVFIDPCCEAGACGLNTAFLALAGAAFTAECQPKAQPGDVDEACPTTAASMIPFQIGGKPIMVPINGFVGCCRENGKCGVVVNDVISPVSKTPLAELDLGCVDAAPFFPNTTIDSCGAASGGAGGAPSGGAASGGAGGAGGAPSGGAASGGAGGAPSGAGAGGASDGAAQGGAGVVP